MGLYLPYDTLSIPFNVDRPNGHHGASAGTDDAAWTALVVSR